MNSIDFPLLLSLVHSHGGIIVGRKRFQKLVCILKYGRGIPFSFEFIPYHYGPYSDDLASAIDRLVGLGLLEEEKYTITNHVIQYSYRLTEEGARMAEAIVRQLGNDDRLHLSRLSQSIEALQDTGIGELVRLSKEAFNQELRQEIYQY